MNSPDFIINKETVNNIKKRLYKNSNPDDDVEKTTHSYFHTSFTIDNFEVTKFVNNDDNIMKLYNKYVKNAYATLDNYKETDEKYTRHNRISNLFYKNEQALLLHNSMQEIEELVRNVIFDICYLRINEKISREYNTDIWNIYNLELNINFIDDICSLIYFDNYQKYDDFIEKYGGVYVKYIVRKEIAYSIIKNISFVNISGDLYI